MDLDAQSARPADEAAPEPPTTRRRSDRWSAGDRAPSGVWAWCSIAFAMLGAASVTLVAMATAGMSPFDRLPDRWAYVAFGSVPSLGLLALVTGLTGRRGSRRWVAWIGVTLGTVLVLGAIAIVIVLSVALRTLG